MMKPEDFLNIVSTQKKEGTRQLNGFKLGVIPLNYVSGRPQVQFDGESSPNTRTYPHLSTYTPTAGDRVLVALVGHGAVVLGKIV